VENTMRVLYRLISTGLLFAALVAASSCSSSSNSSADFCDVYKKAKNETQGLKSTDLASAKRTSAITRDRLTAIDDAAPHEVKSDADKVLAFYKRVDAKVQGAKSVSELSAALNADEKSVQASSDRLNSYTKKNCGVSSSDSTAGNS